MKKNSPKTPVKKINLLLIFLILVSTACENKTVDTEGIIVTNPDTSRDSEGDTFSIVAYDKTTGQVGGAGCSCVSWSGGIDFLSDLITDGTNNPDNIVGAIHSQAAYVEQNKLNARARMLAGDSPNQIITWLQNNDCCSSNANSRQYGVVGVDNPGAAGHTGSSNGNYANDQQTDNALYTFSVQGNILDTANGQDLLDDMENIFNNTNGTLGDKLMAALQAAKRVGGDNRCQSRGNSGRTAFVQVLSPGETSPGLIYDVGDTTSAVSDQIEPIDVLQCLYDVGENTPHCRQTVTSFPYTMDFEETTWEQEVTTCNVNSSWIRSRFASPSSGTGPSGANQGTLYTFVEASNVGGQGTAPRNAMIGSPCFEIPSGHTASMTFDYHMLGTDMGTLSVEASDDGGSSWVSLWSRSGSQGSNWFNDEVIDLTAYAGSTVKLRINALMGNGFTSDMAIDDINITTTPTTGCAGGAKIWDGANWSGGTAPGATNTVTIDGNYNTAIHGNITGCSLTVNTGRTLTVGAGNYLDIEGNIIVDGSLIVEHQGSVVQTDGTASVINNGTINVALDTPNLASRDFMIMGSPMDSETRTGVWNSAFLVLEHLTGNFSPNAAVAAAFPGAENFADDNYDNWVQYNGGIDVGEGYLVRPQSGYGQPGGVFSYTYGSSGGTLNNGDVSFNVLYNTPGPTAADNKNASPNVLANPYASAIFADDFINANPMVDEVYFWEHLTPPSPSLPGAGSMNFSMEDISMYNLMGGTAAGNPPVPSTEPNGYIATGQGFGIKASAAGTAVFTNAMRRTDNNNTLRNQDKDRIWLKVIDTEYQMGGTSLLGFSENATAGLDSGYDSRRLAKIVSIFSHLEDGSQELAIQSREAFESGMKVPFGFSTQLNANLTYKISIEKIEGANIENADVYLIDHLTEEVTNLKNGAYTFQSDKGSFYNRFTVQFEEEVILGTNENSLSAVVVFPNPANDRITIVSPNEFIENVEFYDIQGRRIHQPINENQNRVELNIADLENAIYFVTVTTNSGSITKKIIKR